MRRLGTALLLSIVVALAGQFSVIATQPQMPVLISGCFGVDHPPFDTPNPPPGNSILKYAGSFRDIPPQATANMTVDGPNGALSGTGPVDETARVDVLVGIFRFGKYTVSRFDLTYDVDGQAQTSSVNDLIGKSFNVGPDDVPCSKSQLPQGSIAQVQASPSPSPPPSPAVSPKPSPTGVQEVASEFPWWVLIAVGAGIFLVGLAVWLLSAKDPCDELLRRWQALQRQCDDAQAEADKAERDAEEARNRRQQAEESLDELCEAYPPACAPESWVEDAKTGRRVNNTDTWIGRQWAKQAFDQYKGSPGPEQARATEEAWDKGPSDEFRSQKETELEQAKQQREQLENQRDEAQRAEEDAERRAEEAKKKADTACAAAADAKRAYEECIGQRSAAAEAPTTPTRPTGPTPPAGPRGASAPGTTGTPPKSGDPCEGAEPRIEVIDRFGPRTIIADYSVTVVSQGYRRTEESELMRDQLGDLAGRLDEIGTALSARNALGAALAGETVTAAVGGAGLATGLPTSLDELILETLEKVAQLGSIVAGAAGRWNARNELYNVRVVRFVRRVQFVWKQVWICSDGVWKCQRILEAEWGKLERGQVSSRNDITHEHIEAEARRQTQVLRSQVESQLRELQQFITKYSEGPC